jgi:hypothetical protein
MSVERLIVDLADRHGDGLDVNHPFVYAGAGAQ